MSAEECDVSAQTPGASDDEEDDSKALGYVVPKERPLDELLAQDAEDESLKRYKQTLLGSAAEKQIVIDESNPSRLLLKKIALVVEGREDMVLNLDGDGKSREKQTITMKEKSEFRMRFDFFVQRDLVIRLKYVQKAEKMGLKAKDEHVLGSFAPSSEIQSVHSPMQTAPDGMLARGVYTIKSKLFHDNGVVKEFSWQFQVSKDW